MHVVSSDEGDSHLLCTYGPVIEEVVAYKKRNLNFIKTVTDTPVGVSSLAINPKWLSPPLASNQCIPLRQIRACRDRLTYIFVTLSALFTRR
jgi:hypothetical protein